MPKSTKNQSKNQQNRYRIELFDHLESTWVASGPIFTSCSRLWLLLGGPWAPPGAPWNAPGLPWEAWGAPGSEKVTQDHPQAPQSRQNRRQNKSKIDLEADVGRKTHSILIILTIFFIEIATKIDLRIGRGFRSKVSPNQSSANMATLRFTG